MRQSLQTAAAMPAHCAGSGTSQSADPAPCDPVQSPDPLPILQAVADIVSMDDMSGITAARNSPRDPTDWAAYGAQSIRLHPAKLELLDWSE
jgi:hypothetical protein